MVCWCECKYNWCSGPVSVCVNECDMCVCVCVHTYTRVNYCAYKIESSRPVSYPGAGRPFIADRVSAGRFSFSSRQFGVRITSGKFGSDRVGSGSVRVSSMSELLWVSSSQFGVWITSGKFGPVWVNSRVSAHTCIRTFFNCVADNIIKRKFKI